MKQKRCSYCCTAQYFVISVFFLLGSHGNDDSGSVIIGITESWGVSVKFDAFV